MSVANIYINQLVIDLINIKQWRYWRPYIYVIKTPKPYLLLES